MKITPLRGCSNKGVGRPPPAAGPLLPSSAPVRAPLRAGRFPSAVPWGTRVKLPRCTAVPRKEWAGRLRRPAHSFLLPSSVSARYHRGGAVRPTPAERTAYRWGKDALRTAQEGSPTHPLDSHTAIL